MKKTIILSVLFCVALACKAQIIPVEGVDEYKTTNNTGIPKGAYVKDINGVFNKYIGTWKTTYNNRIYTFFVTKDIYLYNEVKTDKLYVKYLITELDGTVVKDTQNETRNSVFGYKFIDDKTSYILRFSGEKSKCGNKGNIYLSSVSPTQIKLTLFYGAGIVRPDLDICKSYDLSEEPLYPLSSPNFILTKQ